MVTKTNLESKLYMNSAVLYSETCSA